jgi:hypothetical protein
VEKIQQAKQPKQPISSCQNNPKLYIVLSFDTETRRNAQQQTLQANN